MFILTRFPDGVLTVKTWWQDLEAAVHMASASGDRTSWMLVLGSLSFLYIVSSQEMMPPVGGWSAPLPPITNQNNIYRHTQRPSPNDISSWQLRCIASIVLSMYTAFMLSIVRNLEMLLYMREELVHTNSIRTWPATGFYIYRIPDSYPRAHSETVSQWWHISH